MSRSYNFPFSLRVAVGLLLGASLVVGACSEEAAAPSTPTEQPLKLFIEDVNENGHTDVIDLDEAAEVQEHLDHTELNLDVVERVNVPYPDGSTEEMVMIEGDILLTQEQFDEVRSEGVLTGRQYRTSSLVSPQTITIIGYTGGGGYGLTSRQRTALQWAVNNYNALNLRINFQLSYSSSTNADMVVYRNPNDNRTGGSAGFPSGGQPYKWVQLWTGTDNLNTNTIEHVITHEIGHSVGFRHTDYFSRQSCGQNSNEGGNAIRIPGTPSGYDPNSVMLACFGDEDGEFGYYDRVALRYMY